MYGLSRQSCFSCWRLEAANIIFGNMYYRRNVCINGQLSFLPYFSSKKDYHWDTKIFHQQTLQPTNYSSSAYQKFLGMRNTIGHVINSRMRMQYTQSWMQPQSRLATMYM